MTGLRGVNVGDVLHANNYGRQSVMHVTKIGRRWVTCGWNVRFDLDTGRGEDGRSHALTKDQHEVAVALEGARKRLNAAGVELRYIVPADLVHAIDKLVAGWGK